jgi:hypothetical protein
MVSYLHAQPQLRALENVSDDRILELVAGYPRVISRWTAEEARDTAKTFDGLKQLAEDANAFRYRDLQKLLLDLKDDRCKLAARIALVPLVEDPNSWQALRPVILGGFDPSELDVLRRDNVLEKNPNAPIFGHSTRRDAAGVFLHASWPEVVRTETEDLVFSLARSVTAIDERATPYAAALVGLGTRLAGKIWDHFGSHYVKLRIRYLGVLRRSEEFEYSILRAIGLLDFVKVTLFTRPRH